MFKSREEFIDWVASNHQYDQEDLDRIPLPCFNEDEIKEQFYQIDKTLPHQPTRDPDYTVESSLTYNDYLIRNFLSGKGTFKREWTEEPLCFLFAKIVSKEAEKIKEKDDQELDKVTRIVKNGTEDEVTYKQILDEKLSKMAEDLNIPLSDLNQRIKQWCESGTELNIVV